MVTDMSEDVTSCKVADVSKPGFSLTIEPHLFSMGTNTRREEVGFWGRIECDLTHRSSFRYNVVVHVSWKQCSRVTQAHGYSRSGCFIEVKKRWAG